MAKSETPAARKRRERRETEQAAAAADEAARREPEAEQEQGDSPVFLTRAQRALIFAVFEVHPFPFQEKQLAMTVQQAVAGGPQ